MLLENTIFTGSYHENDVQFLLKKINIASTEINEKEKLIQSKGVHYSEMITYEKPPTDEYMHIFEQALLDNGPIFAQHLFALAKKINTDKVNKEIVVVSLARAGTPVGVLVHRMLKKYFNRESYHYSISIIRDKGIDINALNFILNKHQSENIVFLDGWTGKGVIGRELNNAIEQFNHIHHTNISSNLYVVADISGTAYWGATHEDYLLPSAVLNSTISGLISRTILNQHYIGETDFHGCIYYDNLEHIDISQQFVEKMMELISIYYNQNLHHVDSQPQLNNNKEVLLKKSNDTIQYFLKKHQLSNINFIKPGVGESTRVLLRRTPKKLWIKDMQLPQIQHLLYLAHIKQISVEEDKNLSYNAVAIIEELD